MTPQSTRIQRQFMPACVLLFLAVWFAALLYIRQPDITHTEALTLWTVEDARTLAPAAPSDALRIIADNARQTLSRVRETAQMPLYPFLLEIWSIFFGERLFTLRLVSAGLALIGLSLITAAARRFANPQANSQANRQVVALDMLLLAALVPITRYAASTAEPAALLWVFGALTLDAFTRWMKKPTVASSLYYVLALMLAFATHSAAALLIAGCGLVQLVRIYRLVRGNFSLIALYDAMQAVRLTSWLIMSALGALPLLAWSFVVSGESAVASLAPPLVMVLSMLIVLLVPRIAPTSTVAPTSRISPLYVSVSVGIFILLWLASLLLPARPQYTAVLDTVTTHRSPSEPALISYAPHSSAAYFDRVRPFSAGISIDVGWRAFTFDELTQIVEKATGGGLPVWVMMPESADSRNELVEALLQAGYTADWCQPVDGMRFERYQRGDENRAC